MPEEKIRARRARSFAQLALFARHVDRLMIFDNSTAEPKLLAPKRFNQPLVLIDRLPADLIDQFTAAAVPMTLASAKD